MKLDLPTRRAAKPVYLCMQLKLSKATWEAVRVSDLSPCEVYGQTISV